MQKMGFRSAMAEKYGKEKFTFPAKNPIKTIDYIWIKGNQLMVKKVKRFGTHEESDHHGLYAIIGLQKLKHS